MDVSLRFDDDIAVVTLDDGKKNTITIEAMKDLDAAMDEAEGRATAVVLAGRPGSFCAGFDLSVMLGDDPAAIAEIGRRGGAFARRLYGDGRPLVAACTGHAFTIGALWLLGCDTRIGEAGDYRFCMIETQVGYVLKPWTTVLLQARLNPRHYVPCVVQSRIFDPEAAVQAGFLDEVVAPGRAVETAIERARGLVELPAHAYAGNKLGPRREGLAIMAEDLGLDAHGKLRPASSEG